MTDDAQPAEGNAPADRDRGYLTLSGTVLADADFVARLGTAAWLVRLVYNAAIDDEVPFSPCVAWLLARSEAMRAGRQAPVKPTGLPGVRRTVDAAVLRRELTVLIQGHPELREFTRSILDHAVGDACAAIAEHRKRCDVAKAEGTLWPRLHHRRASDGWSVTSDTFTLLRVGDGEPQAVRKKLCVTGKTRRNRLARERANVEREAAWVAEKRRCGWSREKVEFHLARRAERQGRDRRQGRIRQAFHDDGAARAEAVRVEARKDERDAATAEGRKPRKLPPDRVRRDSPSATVGERRMKVDVLGLGRRRVDLGREVPEGAENVRVTYVKPGWRGAKVEMRLVLSVPAAEPAHDEAAIRARLHEIARCLPADATEMQAVEALRAAGILGRGVDLGSAAPFCDDRGVKTRPVRLARRDFQAMKAAQASLSRKDECRRHGGTKPAKGAAKRQGANARIPEGGSGPRAKGVGTKGRSKNARREVDLIRALSHRAADRSHTRACQDARAAMRDVPLLLATEPRRMVRPLLALGGPSEPRRRRRSREGDAAVVALDRLFDAATPATAAEEVRRLPMVLEVLDPPPGAPRAYELRDWQRRAMRRNLHLTRFALRLDRLGALALAAGTVLLAVPNEGTTAKCPACPLVRPKTLGERRHACPCGLDIPRDQASAIVILGRAVLAFREGPDPGGAFAKRLDREARDRGRRDTRRAAMEAGAAKARKRKAAARAAETGGTAPPTPGRGVPGPPVPDKRKRVRGQGRNVGRNSERAKA